MKITETALGKIVETDVLILGAGAAGSGAAIAARREGVDVVLVEKGKLESCGSAGGGNDHFQAPLYAGPDWDTCETFTNFYSKPISGWTPRHAGKRLVPASSPSSWKSSKRKRCLSSGIRRLLSTDRRDSASPGHVVSEYLPAGRRSSERSPGACAPKGRMSSIIS